MKPVIGFPDEAKVKRLDAHTVCHVRVDKVLSPWDCVKELVKNSLQAQAANIAVRVDLDLNNIRLQVLDDGLGVNQQVSFKKLFLDNIKGLHQGHESRRKAVLVKQRLLGGIVFGQTEASLADADNILEMRWRRDRERHLREGGAEACELQDPGQGEQGDHRHYHWLPVESKGLNMFYIV